MECAAAAHPAARTSALRTAVSTRVSDTGRPSSGHAAPFMVTKYWRGVNGGTKVPPGSLVLGSPAKVVRALTPEERAGLKYWAEKYVANGAYCRKHGLNIGAPLPT